jgi:hypothetical protein
MQEPMDGMLMCFECFEKHALAKQREREAQQSKPNYIEKAREIDHSIELVTDLFNAKTVSYVELRQKIDEDDSIPADQKHSVATRVLRERFDWLQQRIFDTKKQLSEYVAEQRVVYVNLNDLASKLSKEEQEKYKIADIKYQPTPPKLKKVRPKVKKYDKEAVRVLARELTNELGSIITEDLVQIFMLRENQNEEKAAAEIRKVFKQS